MEDAIKDNNQIEKENQIIKEYLEKCSADVIYNSVINNKDDREEILRLEKEGYAYSCCVLCDLLSTT